MSGNTFFYPQRMGRIIFLGMEEVIGKSGVDSVLSLAGLDEFVQNYPRSTAKLTFEFESVSLLQQTLEQVYGPRGGRGLPCGRGALPSNMD